jgi:hypothetical protein
MSTEDSVSSKGGPAAEEKGGRMPPYFAGVDGSAVVAVLTSRNHLCAESPGA